MMFTQNDGFTLSFGETDRNRKYENLDSLITSLFASLKSVMLRSFGKTLPKNSKKTITLVSGQDLNAATDGELRG